MAASPAEKVPLEQRAQDEAPAEEAKPARQTRHGPVVPGSGRYLVGAVVAVAVVAVVTAAVAAAAAAVAAVAAGEAVVALVCRRRGGDDL